MAVLNIGVVEDELIIARTIIDTLEEIGYTYCGPAISYTETIELLEDHKPDLLLLDINLSGKKDGIDVAAFINEKYKLPFIFLTANSDAATLDRAKAVNPHAYIVKPFTKEDLFTAIEIAFNNFSRQQASYTEKPIPSTVGKDYLFIKDGYRFQKLKYNEILYLQSEHNYVSILLQDNSKVLVRSQFNDFIEELPAHIFKRVHRSYVVNIEKIKAVEPAEILLEQIKIPLSPAYKNDLMNALGIG